MTQTKKYVDDLMAIEKEFYGITFQNISKDPKFSVYQAELGSVVLTCVPASIVQPRNLYLLGGKFCSKTECFDKIDVFLENAYELMKKTFVDFRLFNDFQKKQIVQGIEEGLPIHFYAKPGLSEDQMELLREGLKLNLPVRYYNSEEFSYGQMYQIQQGLKEKIDISFYLNSDFSAEQMAEIREGLKEGLDVSLYADSAFDKFQMNLIRDGLKKGLDVRQYAYPECDLGEMIRIHNRLEKESHSIDQLIQSASNRRSEVQKEEKKELEMSI